MDKVDAVMMFPDHNLAMASEQIMARRKTHTLSPNRSRYIGMAMRAAVFPDQEQSFLLPSLPFKNENCLCVDCLGVLFFPPRQDPINWGHPHEGDRCPYCNALLLTIEEERSWPPRTDSLYRLLGHDKRKVCDTCLCWL